ncbi:MAG TPA: hypothetical protein VFV96_12830 [Verrucomicrobiae bacterium]|nr:hypothetical protein [Verrucomicrobiae bacterium]
MKEEMKPVQESKPASTFDDGVACDVCGRFGAYRFGERLLCQECYTGSGSCCPEFGKDDLWTFLEEGPKASSRSLESQ